jgi:hypothetical protein
MRVSSCSLLRDKMWSLFRSISSIPGAGFGIFAGDQPYRKGNIVGAGDIVFPIVEYEWHTLNRHEEYPFLWDEYTWTGDTIQMEWREKVKMLIL